jgi:hypothetical protein
MRRSTWLLSLALVPVLAVALLLVSGEIILRRGGPARILEVQDGMLTYESHWAEGEFSQVPSKPKPTSKKKIKRLLGVEVVLVKDSWEKQAPGSTYVAYVKIIRIPMIYVIVIANIGLARWLLWRFRTLILAQRRAERLAAGLCIECGYDLRGNSDRCPECGCGSFAATIRAHDVPICD